MRTSSAAWTVEVSECEAKASCMKVVSLRFQEICGLLEVSPGLLQGRSRRQDVVRDRCCVMRSLYVEGYPFKAIALATRHHRSTVMYHIQDKCKCWGDQKGGDYEA